MRANVVIRSIISIQPEAGVCSREWGAASQPSSGSNTSIAARIANGAAGYQLMPDEQHDHCANRRANQAGPLVKPIPTDSLADKCCQECSRDPDQSCHDEPAWIVGAGCEPTRDQTGNETNNDK